MPNSFGSQSTLTVNNRSFTIHRLDAVTKKHSAAARLPFSLKVLLENLLRTEDGLAVRPTDIEALAKWNPTAAPSAEIAFTPSRVLLQDFTGVPCVVDLAAMRDAIANLGGDAGRINPLQPVELVIDHSVQVDEFGSVGALLRNAEVEYARNTERYIFLRWGQSAFRNFKVVPPDTGIVHQVNLEYLARVVFVNEAGVAYPDTVVGTDSHTTMINGLGVLGWGVGGIEAEAAMLGQPISMLIPQVVGFKLHGQLPAGATATDLVLTVTQMLRKKGVVGKFVEFFGPGIAALTLADRATIANMAPEYGATCGIFPIDAQTLQYLRFTNRSEEQARLVEAYAKEQGLFHTANSAEPAFSDTLELDLATVEPSLAGPSRPQDRVRLGDVKKSFTAALPNLLSTAKPKPSLPMAASNETWEGGHIESGPQPHAAATVTKVATPVQHGSVVIAAITSCTNTSNPSVLIAAGLLAKNAVGRGLKSQPHVKTSLAPGSKVVTEYLKASGLLSELEKLNFHVVGYGCTTCIGNSGPLPEPVSRQIADKQLVVAAVLSGNRNFEGRVHAEVRANYLASPPLVVAYALAGRVDLDLTTEPLGTGNDGKPVYLKDIWPNQADVQAVIDKNLKPEMYRQVYSEVFTGDEHWRKLQVPTGDRFAWDARSTYVKHPPYFEGMSKAPAPVTDINGARVLAVLGDSITTDHISPAGSIKKESPAGQYLIGHGVQPADFNSYGSRRGNHEVMVRGTFANVRLRNKMAPGTEGGFTRHMPDGATMSIFEASERYLKERVPLIVLAGKEYGSGSSRDWAAKGPMLLGVRAVIAESYERIHRSNLVGMGVLPLQFRPGDSVDSLKLTGEEVYSLEGLAAAIASGFSKGRELAIHVKGPKTEITFHAIARIDTPQEVLYFQHGGILQYVLRQLLK
jgi:aconitate hydratase A / 2-methylisocitrate dehydratase